MELKKMTVSYHGLVIFTLLGFGLDDFRSGLKDILWIAKWQYLSLSRTWAQVGLVHLLQEYLRVKI